VQITHAAKGKEKIERGDRWLETLLGTLRRGVSGGRDSADLEEEEEEVPAMTDGQVDEALGMFKLVAGLDTHEGADDAMMSKEELIKAHGT